MDDLWVQCVAERAYDVQVMNGRRKRDAHSSRVNNDPEVMLPPFKRTVERFRSAFAERLRRRVREDGILSEIRGHIIHEGGASIIVRQDGEKENVEMHESSGELKMKFEDVGSFDLDAVFKAMSEIAEQIAGSQAKHLFGVFNEVTTKTGNVVDGRGRQMDHDLFFQMLEKVQHGFRGGPEKPDLVAVVHPSMLPRLAQLDEEFRASPELQKRHSEIMARKYEQFRDQEMARTLAG